MDDRSTSCAARSPRLGEGPDGGRLVLFVDDAHLLDDASATLVHQVATTGNAIVLATVRTGEPAPDPVVALWKDGLAERVEVTGLSDEATAEFLAAVLDGPVDPATAVRFTERCQGNALFLRELVIGALDDGSLQSDGGMWRLVGQLSPSPRLVEIVEAHFGRLGDNERALMELVAYGGPLGLAELALLSDPALAEGLERRDLLASRMDGRRSAGPSRPPDLWRRGACPHTGPARPLDSAVARRGSRGNARSAPRRHAASGQLAHGDGRRGPRHAAGGRHHGTLAPRLPSRRAPGPCRR